MAGKGRPAAMALFLVLFAVVFIHAGCGKADIKLPVIDGFTPQQGPVGTRVTIDGRRFSGVASDNVVRFNGVQATVLSATDTQLVVTVPSGAATGSITVTTLNGTGGTVAFFTVLRIIGGGVQGSSLTLAGSVTTIAGVAGVAGATDGTGSGALFRQPFGLTTDGFTLFIADQGNHVIRALTLATGAVVTIAGASGITGSVDGTGNAARFNAPAGITTDGSSLFICDSANHTIRKLAIGSRVVTTLAGSPGIPGSADGTGGAARFNAPAGISSDGTFLYVCDSGNNTVRRIDPVSGAVVTIAGIAGVSGSNDVPPLFNNPVGITSDGTRLFIADRNNQTLRVLTLATSSVLTIAGFPGLTGSANGPGSVARFNSPSGIITDGRALYLSDSNNHTIRTFVPLSGQFDGGTVSLLAGSAGVPGALDGTGAAALFRNPAGITTDGTALYVADSLNNSIRKVQ